MLACLAPLFCVPREYNFVATEPTVVRASLTIWHPELRDLLQSTGRKNELLCVNNFELSLIDFNNDLNVSG
jgi:hypothetical protein